LRQLPQGLRGVRAQRIKEDPLGRFVRFMLGIIAATTRSGLGQFDPIAGSIRSAQVVGRLDEGFQQPGLITVALLPILRESARRQAQQVAGQMRHLDAGPNQEARVVDDAMEIFSPRLVAPTDPLIAWLEPAGRRTESQHAQEALRTTNQITHLHAAEPTAQGMKGFEQLAALPGSGAVPTAYPHQLYGSDLLEAPHHGRQLRWRMVGATGPEWIGEGMSGFGQNKQARALQPLEGDAGVSGLPGAGGPAPVQPLAQLARQGPTRQAGPLLLKACDEFRTEFSPANNHRATLNP